MKSILCLLLSVCLTSCQGQMLVPNTRPNKLKTNLMTANTTGAARVAIAAWGQSNLGQGLTTVASDLEGGYKQEYTNVKFYQYSASNNVRFVNLNYADNTTYQAPVQTGVYSLQFYLYTELATLLGKDLYVVHHSIGNTGLAVEWKPTATIGQEYRDFVFKTQAANNAITDADGVAPSFKFMLIVHGEYDARVQAYADAYETNLTNFITNFRTQTGLTNLPVVIVKVNSAGLSAPVNPLTYVATVRTAQANVAANMTNVYTVESNGAAQQTDLIHYTVAGEHTLVASILAVVAAHSLLN